MMKVREFFLPFSNLKIWGKYPCMEPFVYFLPSTLSFSKVQEHLPRDCQYQLLFEQGEMHEAVLLDTFDNGLFHTGKLLFLLEGQLLLLDLQGGQMFEQSAPAGRMVIGEMKKGPVVEMLQEVSTLRALLPLAQVRVRREEGRLLDDEGKTLVRLYHLTIGRGRRKLLGMGYAHYLRGYAEAYTDLQRGLESCGAKACQNGADLYSGLALKERFYSAKPEIPLLPETSVKESAVAILRTFLAVARQNEEHIIADSDSEFLHDYRVSLRKARSVISLCKGVFDARESLRLKEKLAGIMRLTNGLRDLDVYLLNRAEYLRLVPPAAHGGLYLLFDVLLQKRKGEQKKLSGGMQGKGYVLGMEHLEKMFAASDCLKDGPQAGVQSLVFAKKQIMKRYRKVCKSGRALDETTPDELIHQLRINCKKLRYLMEFFTPLFPSAKIKSLIRSLKGLQDNLGNFNDYSVQQQYLGKMSLQDVVGGEKALSVSFSIGALTAMLYQLQKEERGRIMANLAAFDSSEIREAFTELFLIKEGVDEDHRLLQQ